MYYNQLAEAAGARAFTWAPSNPEHAVRQTASGPLTLAERIHALGKERGRR
jgi:hypothetical protein